MFDLLASEDSSNTALNKLGRCILLFLLGHLDLLALCVFARCFFLSGLGDLLVYLDVAKTALTPTFILLDEPNGRHNFHVKRKRVMNDLHLWLGRLVSLLKDFVNEELLFLH